jgi:2-polyprenyl-3-methyl-5-hydroxy-6-metoxy-1,4-benzoquinol methylase
MEFRLQMGRYELIPWLEHTMPLRGKRILEIGCGTGAATVALAEQGANVAALERMLIDERIKSLQAAWKLLDTAAFSASLKRPIDCGRTMHTSHMTFSIGCRTIWPFDSRGTVKDTRSIPDSGR